MHNQIFGSQTIFLICAGFIFGGALLGLLLSGLLPEGHLRDKSEATVRVATGMIATLAALVLGLLINSAKNSFEDVDKTITETGAKIILMDRALANYGPETKEARDYLRSIVIAGIEIFWPGETSRESGFKEFERTAGMEVLQTKIRQLTPTTDLQRQLRSDADKLSSELLAARWLLIAKAQHTIPKAFLVVLLFWLTVLHISFGLLAPRNGTAIAMLLVSALSVSGAVFLILEMNKPLDGLIKVSSAPLHKALELMGR